MRKSLERIESYWDTRPCNIRHSRADIDTDPLRYSQEVTARKLRVEPHIRRHANFVRWRDCNVLDVGCGIGTQTIEFAKRARYVLGVDVSSKSLQIAGKRVTAEGLSSKVQLIQMDLQVEELVPAQFHLLYSFGVLHHMPYPGAALRNVRSALLDDAEIRIMLYHRYSWKALWILATYGKMKIRQWDALVQEHSEAQTGCPHTTTWTRQSARELLESTGYTVDKMEVDHIFPYRIADYIKHRYVKEWYWRYLPLPFFHLLEKWLGWHLLIWGRRV